MMRSYQADRGITLRPEYYVPGREPIRIGNDVWIGENVTLGKGITVGDGAIIASNATVTRDVEPYSIVGGLPAKSIKRRFADDVVDLLQQSQWWLYEPTSFEGLDPLDPKSFAVSVIESAEAQTISPYKPQNLLYSDFQALA